MEEKKSYRAHVCLLPYPSQGHINSTLQFAKRLVSKEIKATLAITNFFSKTIEPKLEIVGFDTTSDGYDEGGFMKAENLQTYLKSLETIGSQTLGELIKKQESLGHPNNCVVYDAILPWALDITKEFGIMGAAFFTQACVVNFIYYEAYHGLLTLPISSSDPISIPGLPMALNLDLVLFNTFYKLDDEASHK